MFKLANSFRGVGRIAAVLAVVATSFGPIGCSKPKPPPQPKSDPIPDPAPEPPPPPPSCEALDEVCEADENTLLPVPGTSLVFTPPAGWSFAKLEKVTLVQKEEGGAIIIIGSHPLEKNGFKRVQARSEYARGLLDEGELKTPQQLQLNRPQEQDEVGEVRLGKWIALDTARGDRKGELLSFAGPSEEQEVVGVAFAPDDDEEAIGAILDALKTLHTGAEEGDEGEDDEAQ